MADVGAGTGIFSRILLAHGYEVWAVEPNGDMRTQAAVALQDAERCHLCPTSAEDTGLKPGSVELVTAAQAFHWFDAPHFQAECLRILAPGGAVALIWNSRVSDHPIHQENEAICRNYCPHFKGFSGGMGENPQRIEDFFLPNGYEYTQYPNDQCLDLESFLGRSLSSSYAPRPGEANYEPYRKALTMLFERWSQDGRILLPNHTQCYLGFLTRA